MEARAKMEQLDIQLNEYKDELTTAQEMVIFLSQVPASPCLVNDPRLRV